jgi:hypothetical protein
VLIVYKNWFVGVTPGRSSASFQHIKSFVQTNTKVIFTKNLLHVNVCQTCVTMVPLLYCSSKCVLLYPSETPNPDTTYTILPYTIRLYGKNRIVEVQNRVFGQGYTCVSHYKLIDANLATISHGPGPMVQFQGFQGGSSHVKHHGQGLHCNDNGVAYQHDYLYSRSSL